MRKEILLLPILIFCGTVLFGQDGLLLRNKKSGEILIYRIHSRISYMESEEQEFISGKIRNFLDSSVLIGKDTVALKDILIIRKKTTAHKIARIAGIPIMLIGVLLMGDGIAGIYSDSGEGLNFLLAGVGVFAVGYLPYELNYKELTVGQKGEWSLEHYRKPD